MRRDLDPSNRREKLFGKEKYNNPFYKPSRKVVNKSKSSLDYTPFKGTFRTNPPPNKEKWTSIISMN